MRKERDERGEGLMLMIDQEISIFLFHNFFLHKRSSQLLCIISFSFLSSSFLPYLLTYSIAQTSFSLSLNILASQRAKKKSEEIMKLNEMKFYKNVIFLKVRRFISLFLFLFSPSTSLMRWKRIIIIYYVSYSERVLFAAS